jgi:hypothetical protein
VKRFDLKGQVYVARRSTPVTGSAGSGLVADTRALVTYKRFSAVGGLANVLSEKHPGPSLTARLKPTRLASDDHSCRSEGQAQQVLDGAGELPDVRDLTERPDGCASPRHESSCARGLSRLPLVESSRVVYDVVTDRA